jgi:hypothetical protein
MPSSALPLVPTNVFTALEHKPRTVLDVGPGHGKYGLLLREYAPWLERLDAVEGEPRYLERFPWLERIYDNVIVGDVAELFGMELFYDLVLMVDVLEHLDHDAGEALLRRIPGRVIVCTPAVFFQNPEADQGFETERHRSLWTVAELAAIRPLEVEDVYAASIGGILVRMAPLA